jgi:hypothetical protein
MRTPLRRAGLVVPKERRQREDAENIITRVRSCSPRGFTQPT